MMQILTAWHFAPNSRYFDFINTLKRLTYFNISFTFFNQKNLLKNNN